MPGTRHPDDDSDALDPEQGRLLHGQSPREVLFRIAEGDPLEIGARADALLEEEGLMLAPERVHLRALAQVAYVACARGAPRELGPWLRQRIAESVDTLLAEDREAERVGDPLPASVPHFLAMTAAFGVEHGLSRRASVAFHSLPASQRRLVRALVQEGRSLADLAQAQGRPLGEVRSELRLAVESLERAIGTRLAERLGGGDRG
jgi:DNA-directed RNA polymerase specialized sigma24 family protein